VNDAGFAVGWANVLTNGALPWAIQGLVDVPGVGVRMLPSAHGGDTAAWGINNLGDIVGTSHWASNLGGVRTTAWDINDQGQIVG
jgi:hypothetical protein